MNGQTLRAAFAVVVLLAAAKAHAGDLDRVGTAGAQELRIPVGAASVAIGGSAVALGNGLENLYYNPASLAATDQSEAIASYSTYLFDSRVNYGAVSTHLGTQGTIAFAAKVLNVGDITVTTEDAPEGTGQILSPSFSVLSLAYGRRMTDRVLLGVTGSYVSEQIADARATGVAFDFGVQYDTGWRGLRFGFTMKNVGPNMRYGGASFEQRIQLPGDDPTAAPHVVRVQPADFELPSYLQFGASYDVPVGGGERHATFYGAFQGNNFSTDEYRLGGEFPVGNWLVLRGGYVGQAAMTALDRQEDYLYSWTYGAGINFKMGDRPVSFDWAGTRISQYFSDNQQFSLSIAF